MGREGVMMPHFSLPGLDFTDHGTMLGIWWALGVAVLTVAVLALIEG
jgi:hypothetical protein